MDICKEPATLAYLDWCKEKYPEVEKIEDTQRADWIKEFYREWKDLGNTFNFLDYQLCMGEIHYWSDA